MTSTADGMLHRAGLGEPVSAEEQTALHMRIAMAMAIISVPILKLHDTYANWGCRGVITSWRGHWSSSSRRCSRSSSAPRGAGLVLFAVAIIAYVLEKWSAYHNHGWLSFWTITVAFLFGTRWWEDEDLPVVSAHDARCRDAGSLRAEDRGGHVS